MGEFESVETAPEVTSVSFRDRKTAEKFYYSLHGKELPGVTGRLDLSWVNGGPALPPAATAKPEYGGGDDTIGGVGGREDEDEGEIREEEPVRARGQQRQINMDYEVEDEDGWIG
jgi:RNA-binding protein 26